MTVKSGFFFLSLIILSLDLKLITNFQTFDTKRVYPSSYMLRCLKIHYLSAKMEEDHQRSTFSDGAKTIKNTHAILMATDFVIDVRRINRHSKASDLKVVKTVQEMFTQSQESFFRLAVKESGLPFLCGRTVLEKQVK